MAPTKHVRGATNASLLPLARKALGARSHITQENVAPAISRGKRKADISPLKNDKIKRSALGNLTNNVTHLQLDDKKTKQDVASKKTVHIHNTKNAEISKKSLTAQDVATSKILTRAAAKNATKHLLAPSHPPQAQSKMVATTVIKPSVVVSEVTVVKNKDTTIEAPCKPSTRRISNEFEKTEESLYMTALEDITCSDSIRFSGNFEPRRSLRRTSDIVNNAELLKKSVDDKHLDNNRIQTPSPLRKPPRVVPGGVVDFDKEVWNDPFQVSHYVMDIFEYLKEREAMFQITDYMETQVQLSKWMRSLLVDWMVEVQETFELNHETLYLGVKLVDMYLMRKVVSKDKLQLLGATSLFVACKYDERTPPLVEDFLYICDGAYTHNEIVKMEMDVLRTVDFDLSVPLSYRFLRRYARCSKIQMQTLTLARYILELSLMDYSLITLSDSQVASAALFVALRMSGVENAWDKTLEYYTGYKLEDFAYIVPILVNGLQRKPREAIKTIRNKYSHKIFFEVTKVPLLSLEKIFENTGLIQNVTASTSGIAKKHT